jgi:hypothetical protein
MMQRQRTCEVGICFYNCSHPRNTQKGNLFMKLAIAPLLGVVVTTAALSSVDRAATDNQ